MASISLDEANRRILEVAHVSGSSLDLSECSALVDLSPLSGLKAVRVLVLLQCEQITDLSPLSGLTGLRSLHLGWCRQIMDLRPLSPLRPLRSLTLAGCEQITDIGPLSGLTDLLYLDLGWCRQITDLRPLSGFKALESLKLVECERITDLRPLSKLKSLGSLLLNGCTQISDLRPLSRLTALRTLELNQCHQITDLRPLAGLTGLRALNLAWCLQLADFSLLSGWSALGSLDLSGCQITDLRLLSGMKSLLSLRLDGCRRITDLRPLTGLTALSGLSALDTSASELPLSIIESGRLRSLYINRLTNVPDELQSANSSDDCLPRLAAWLQDLKAEAAREREVKLILLGNGGVGKTQLCRFLRSLPYDDHQPTTHGIQIAHVAAHAEPTKSAARLNLWDFGGQDIYHGTHALFLKGHAVFLILWTPEAEEQSRRPEVGNPLRHRPLSYWVDYVLELAGAACPVIIVQSQCEARAREQGLPEGLLRIPGIKTLAFSARTRRHGVNALAGAIRDAVEELESAHPSPPLGRGWVRVRDEVRRRLAEDGVRSMEMPDFADLCAATGGVSNHLVLLEYLHRAGVVFYRDDLFGGKIIVDQNWALEAIYTVFDRERVLPWLRGNGSFTVGELARYAWAERGLTLEEQKLFVSMMESCGLCFPWKKNSAGEVIWIAPDLLPFRDAVQERLAGRLRKSDLPRRRYVFHYRFLHEGIIRQMLSIVGRNAQDAAVYWRHGLWLYESNTETYAVVEAREEPTEEEAGKGVIELLVYGDRSDGLAKILWEVISRTEPRPCPISDAPPCAMDLEMQTSDPFQAAAFTSPAPAPRGARPAVFISFAWGDDSPTGQRRQAVVDGLCARLDREGLEFQIDYRAVRTGDSISAFMKNFGTADHVIAVISDKYLRSPYCMAELHSLWQNCNADSARFSRRAHALFLDDARAASAAERLAWVDHWKTELEALETMQKKLGRDFGVGDQQELKVTAEFALHVSDILRWLTDARMPRGFEQIQKDNYQAIVDLVKPAP